MSDFARLLRLIHQLRRNLVIVRESEDPEPRARRRRIDVWWGRERHNAGLMVTLAYLVQASPEWRGAELELRTIVADEGEREQALAHLQTLIDSGRLDAVARAVRCRSDDPLDEIRESSRDADLVFLGMRPPGSDETLHEFGRYYWDLMARTAGYPPTAIVLAAEDIEFQRIFE